MYRISIIIATYNRADELIEALGSVAAQQLPADEWECVVVNNNSSDDTVAKATAFGEQHPHLNFKVVTELKQGLSHARNCGITHSSGEYIAIIDDDERINPQFASSYIKLFDKHPSAAAAGGVIIAQYSSERPKWMSRYTERPIANPMNLGTRECQFPKTMIPGGGNMALRRSTINKVGLFNPELGRCGTKLIGGEENDLFERIRQSGGEVWYAPNAIMWHIIPPSKLTIDYFTRLSYNIGVSQQTRASLNNRLCGARFMEIIKWGATLLIALGQTLSLHPAKASWLMRMRYHISRGIFSKQ